MLDAKTWGYNWQFSVLTSFGSTMPDGYDGVFRDFWNRQLEADVEQVVDLACGNGALTWIFHAILNSGGPAATITGFDFADIDPFKALQRRPADYPGVRFFGNVHIENLPLEDDSIDLAASQYGVEYSNLEQTIPEIARIVKPGGKMAFILHDRDGAVVQGSTKHIPTFKRLVRESRLHKLILDLGELAKKSNYDTRRLYASAEYRALAAKLHKEQKRFSSIVAENDDVRPLHSYMNKLTTAYQEAPKPPAARKYPLHAMIDDAVDSFNINIESLEDLKSNALDETGRRRLHELIESQGFRVTESEAIEYNPGENWGTTLVAECRQ